MGLVRFKVHSEGMSALRVRIKASEGPASHAVAVQAAKDTEIYVPMLTGSQSNRTQVEGNIIIYYGPYAHYLYEGKVMVDSVTGKGPMKIVDQNGNEYIRFRKGARLVATGRDLHIQQSRHPKAQSHWFEASEAQNMEKWEKVGAEEIIRGLK